MKKIIALLLAVVALFSLTACSALVAGFKDGYNDAISELNEEENKEVTRGSIDGNVYTSEFTGLTFTKPDSWTYSSDEELAELIDVSQEDIDLDVFSKTATEIASVYDMMVVDNTTGTNIVLGYENVSITNGGSISEEDYIAAVQSSVSTTLSAELIDRTDVTLGDNTYLRAGFSIESQGIEMVQVYYIRSMGDFVNFIIVTIPSGYETADIEAMFS